MTVKLTYDHGVPVQADTLLDQPDGALDSGNLFTLTYKYSPNFAGGRFPVEFANYYYPAPGRREKSFTIRVARFGLRPAPSPSPIFDYHQAMNRRQMQVDVWTNGVRYRETPNGLVTPPTLEELAAGDTRRFQSEAFGRAPGAPGRRNPAGPGNPVRACSPGSPSSQCGLALSVLNSPSSVWPFFYWSGGGGAVADRFAPSDHPAARLRATIRAPERRSVTGL